jgi:hypothetical protein
MLQNIRKCPLVFLIQILRGFENGFKNQLKLARRYSRMRKFLRGTLGLTRNVKSVGAWQRHWLRILYILGTSHREGCDEEARIVNDEGERVLHLKTANAVIVSNGT